MRELIDPSFTFFFITGCYRSGTTLIDKYLSNHPNCLAFSQPITPLFIQTKEAFYKEVGISSKKYLGVGVDPIYDPATFEHFLSFKNLKQETREILHQAYESLLSKLEYEASDAQFPADFRSIFIFFLKLLYKRSIKSIAALGLKEILCHEYISYLTNNGVKVVLIVRDPRSVIESLNFGAGDQFTGGIRPTLLNLHNWREVAEIGLQHQKNDNLLLIKYEEFISDLTIRKKLTDFLQLEHIPIDISALKDMDGNTWKVNSSFGSRKREKLDREVTQYIESICFFEMRALGYQTSISSGIIPEIVKAFEEPWTISPRDYYPLDYSTNPEHVDREVMRWRHKMKSRTG